MNKKQLIIAAMAAVLSVTGAYATNISGFDATSGTFNIHPEKVNGTTGYRAYDNFDLSSGDIANLIYKYNLGDQRDIDAFVNLVQNGVNVNGILNTLDGNGKFTNGHAIFITPGGLTVGASGVLNVGTLSVATPTPETFGDLMGEYNATKFVPTNINQISKLMKNSSGNAPIDIKGYVFARNGVTLPGSSVDVSGKIINGMSDSFKVDNSTNLETLFNSLVNTDNIQSKGSLVFLNTNHSTNGGINVSGNIVNLTNGSTNSSTGDSVAITNAGSNGVTISGNIQGNGKLGVYNKAGNMNISGKLQNKNGELAVTNSASANAMTLTSSAKLTNENGDVSIVNNGKGALSHGATVNAAGALNIVNDSNANKASNSALTVSASNTADTVRIVNRGSNLAFTNDAKATANKSVSFRNYGNGGMSIDGTVTAEEGVLVDNYAGNLDLTGSIKTTKTTLNRVLNEKTNQYENVGNNIAVINRSGAGKLTTSTQNEMKVENGFISIRNESESGSEFNGTLTNKNGEIALNNTAGAMNVNGDITAENGNVGIINKESGTGLTIGSNAEINTKGTLKLVNQNGNNGLVINSDSISNDGDMFVYNEKGQMTVNGNLSNQNGNLYLISRANSTGIVTDEESNITNVGTKGDLAIKHKGASGGLNLNGNVSNTATNGQIAINNYSTGNMYVGGTVTSNGKMGIVNRADGGTMNVDATINANGSETNIKNLGKGNMTLAGTVNHNGRLNVLGNTNKTILDGTIVNKGSGLTYATSRASGTGLEATSNFNATATNGDILIKNITGQNGLNFAGTINSTNGQAEVYNKAGSMTIANTANVTGNKPFILNGNGNDNAVGLTVNSTKLPSNIMIVNKGSQAATVPSQYRNNNNFREKLRN